MTTDLATDSDTQTPVASGWKLTRRGGSTARGSTSKFVLGKIFPHKINGLDFLIWPRT